MEQNEISPIKKESLEANSVSLLSNGKDFGGVKITGTGSTNLRDLTSEDNLSDVKYISNANYFIVNPKHFDTYDTHNNKNGTCTTVAVQMLLGYHNYYSDRRIIPTSGNGRTFLNDDYGNVNKSPNIDRPFAYGQGCPIIGTEDGVYEEIFASTYHADDPVLGQSIGRVTNGAKNFINNFTAQEAKNGISLNHGLFSSEEAHADIDAGLPIVLGLAILLPKANFHVIPAYGYAKLNGEDGFLVHYGWGSAGTQVWIPESWVHFQIRMSVNHTHELIDTGIDLKNTHRELSCNECGYKTVDSLYNVSESTIMSVKYSLNETVLIPSSVSIYSETTASFVTQTIDSIAPTAFANHTEIKKVDLYNSITSIGNGAFAGCTSLTSIKGSSNLEFIGEKAFAGCLLLTNISLPSGLTNIGIGVFAGCNNLEINVLPDNLKYSSEDNILYDKDKRKIISTGKLMSNEITIPDTVTEIGAYAFAYKSNLEKIHIFGNPTIKNFSFFGSENLKEVYFYSYDTPNIGLSIFSSNLIKLYVPHIKQLDYALALDSYNMSIDSLPINVIFKDCGSTVANYNLHYGELINTLPTITRIGYDFAGWYENTDFTGTLYEINGIWDSLTNITVYAKWTAQQYQISFSGYGCENLDDITVTYDCVIGELPIIERVGYTFYGWKDQYGEYYTSNKLWQKLNNVGVTPDLRAKQYTIIFNANGGKSSSALKSVKYDSTVTSLATASKEGHAFLGWNTAINGTGTQITAPFVYNIASNIMLYAQYSPEEYTLSFNKCGGSGGSNGVNATFGEPLPIGNDITPPTRTGYTFDGYYQSELDTSAKYYDENMNGLRNWDIASSATLYAHWIPNIYTITIDSQVNLGFDQEIVSTSSSDIKYFNFTPIESGAITIWTMHTTGDPYLYLYDANGTLLQSNDDGNGRLDSKIIHSVVSGNQYKIGFRAFSTSTTKGKVYCSGVAISSLTNHKIIATFGSELPSPNITLERPGYSFNGLYTQPNGSGIKYYNSQLNPIRVWSIASNTILYAYWTPNSYTVIFDKDGGFGGTISSQTTYLSTLPSNLTIPTKTGYTFDGYYSQENGTGCKYYDKDMQPIRVYDIPANATLYAKWIGNKYTVTLNSGGNGGSDTVQATFGSPMPTQKLVAPQKAGHTFLGYYTGENGTGKQYYVGPDMTSSSNWDIASDTILYAHWQLNSYLITFEQPSGHNHVVRIDYGALFPDNVMKTPKNNGRIFDGYYYNNVKYYKEDIYDDRQEASIYGYDHAYYYRTKLVDNTVRFYFTEDITLTPRWSTNKYECNYTYECKSNDDHSVIGHGSVRIVSGESFTVNAPSIKKYEFDRFVYDGNTSKSSSITLTTEVVLGLTTGILQPNVIIQAWYGSECVCEGTLITLADGTQVPVESLNGTESLLVWNMYTGQFDTAPILFIDSDPAKQYSVINLTFSDSTIVRVVSEHGFWDCTLNEYVYLRRDAEQYIGHYFIKQGIDSNGDMTSYSVQLTNVTITQEYTTVYSPVTYGHLCYYVNGMLSMPGGIEGLFNIFEVDCELMKYDMSMMEQDILTYGLYTYEEFAEILPVTEDMFNAVSGQYLKVAIGKGLITIETLQSLISRYAVFFD